MCDKCEQIEARIHRYRKFVTHGFDRLSVERINALIEELEQHKVEMHEGSLG